MSMFLVDIKIKAAVVWSLYDEYLLNYQNSISVNIYYTMKVNVNFLENFWILK